MEVPVVRNKEVVLVGITWSRFNNIGVQRVAQRGASNSAIRSSALERGLTVANSSR